MRGHPARRESNSWREAIRDAVKAAHPQAPFTSTPLATKFTVEVIFRMTPEDLARPAVDLDNFAKPVLDTLFTSQNVSKSRLTGVLLPVNDTWVFRLVLEKVGAETPQDQGADITVTSHPPGTPGSQHCFGFSLRVKAEPSYPAEMGTSKGGSQSPWSPSRLTKLERQLWRPWGSCSSREAEAPLKHYRYSCAATSLIRSTLERRGVLPAGG